MSQVITVLVGTTKGLFLLHSDVARQDWTVKGPLCDGWGINHAIGDAGTGTLWAGGGGEWSGAGVWRSTDGGESWALSKLADGTVDEWIRNDPETAAFFGSEPKPPAEFTGRVESIWSLGRVNGKLYAGAKPATLFVSENGGESWAEVDSLTDHPSADSWTPGAAGLTLHTIVASPADPQKLWLGISAAGVFASEDGGGSWERRNRLSNAEACGHVHHPAGPRDGETGHCVHNMVRAPGDPDLLYQQNHHGVWRSSGRRAQLGRHHRGPAIDLRLSHRRASRRAAHALDPAAEQRHGRAVPARGQAAVWRSRDGGETWEACREGCPPETVSSPCCGRPWRRTGPRRPGSISGPTRALSLPLSMKATAGRKSPGTCPRCFASRR